MKNMIVLLTILLTVVACTAETGSGIDAALSGGFPDKAEQVSALVSQANNHIQSQQYQRALNDIESALSLAPEHAENRFLYCMLKERVGERLALTQACYAQVVEKLSKNSEMPCQANINCVVADLMAGGDKAQELKSAFLSLPASEVESEMRHYLLDDFERERYLRMILP